MEGVSKIQKLVDEYKKNKLNSVDFEKGMVKKLILEKLEENNAELESNKREQLKNEIISNLEILNDFGDLLGFIKNNEGLMVQDLIFGDLNKNLNILKTFIDENIILFNTGGQYANIFSTYVRNIDNKHISFLGDFRQKSIEKLEKEGIYDSKESFYTKIMNDLFDIINQINNNLKLQVIDDFPKLIYNNPENEDENLIENQIGMNNDNLLLIFDLIDKISNNKNLILGDIKKGYFKYAFENIQEFLDVNGTEMAILMENNIFYEYFLRIILLINNGGKETVGEIENYMNINGDNNIIINNEFYNKMKEEFKDIVNYINMDLEKEKNNLK